MRCVQAGPARRVRRLAGRDPGESAAPIDEEPPDDDEIDLAELVDEDGGVPAVDSVTLITQSLGATVVEEVPRD